MPEVAKFDPRKLGSAAYHPVARFASAQDGELARNAVPPTRRVNDKPLAEDIEITAADLGVDRVDNTPDADKVFEIEQIGRLRYELDHLVPQTTTVNGHLLDADVELTAKDLGLEMVPRKNLEELDGEFKERNDHRYQPTSTTLDQLAEWDVERASGFPIFLTDAVGVMALEDMPGYIGLGEVDNTPDALKFLRFTRHYDKRYIRQSQLDNIAVILQMTIDAQFRAIDQVQSTFNNIRSSLSRAITALAQDPGTARQTSNALRAIVAEMEEEGE